MRTVRFHEYGGPEVLGVDEVARPEPGPDEVLVAVEAASVNPVDGRFRAGVIPPDQLPATLGMDVAGVVAEVGARVTGFTPGDRVFGIVGDPLSVGGYAEYTVAPTDHLATLPDPVHYTAGAALATSGLTAWRALVEHGRVNPTDACLVHGGSGGVGHLAVQLADVSGAHVLATAGAADRRERVLDLGADAVFDYGKEALGDAIVKAAPDGIDVSLDHRLHDYLELDVRVAARGGRIIGIGGDVPALDNTRAGWRKELTVQLMSAVANAKDIAEPLRRLARLASTSIDVEVADTFALEEAAAAHRTLESEQFVGKLVIEP